MKAKQCLSILLSAAMLTAAFPPAVFAEETTESDAATDELVDEIIAEMEAEENADPEDEEAAEPAPAEEEREAEKTVTMNCSEGIKEDLSVITYPCYLVTLDTSVDIPLYFADEGRDIPYINLADWRDATTTLFCDVMEEENYSLELEIGGAEATFTRENGYQADFDFEEGTITFDDFDAFLHDPDDKGLLDVVSINEKTDDGSSALIRRNEKGSYDRYGKEVTLDLKEYSIPVYWSEEEQLYLLPLQTLGDFFLSFNAHLNTFFTPKGVYLFSVNTIGMGEFLTPLGEAIFGTPEEQEARRNRPNRVKADPNSPNEAISEELAWFNYNELCLTLDNLYGLKDLHGIEKFDDVFEETGYRDKLLDLDPGKEEGALYDFIQYHLDDKHTGFIRRSYRSEDIDSYYTPGISSKQRDKDKEMYLEARSAADHEIQCYEEVGNTAYITFDNFYIGHPAQEYYAGEVEPPQTPDQQPFDTAALILYAHKQITRENSPIENVVLDLSLNGGGDTAAAALVASWFLGESKMSIMNSLTGARATGLYQFDANLDGSFDTDDSVADKNLYCLVSPLSFSCGNLVPSILKESHKVTILGKTSGGGSCLVLGMTTALGTCFQISSPLNMAYVKNGTYYSSESGVEPDAAIDKPAHFYDREGLTDFINNLF